MADLDEDMSIDFDDHDEFVKQAELMVVHKGISFLLIGLQSPTRSMVSRIWQR